MALHAFEPPSRQVQQLFRAEESELRPPPSASGRAVADGSASAIVAQLTGAEGTVSASKLVTLQRAVGNAGVGGVLRGAAPTKPRAKVNLDLGWLDLTGGGIQSNQQLAAVARLAIAALESDLTDVESEQVKADAREWIATIRGVLPYFDRHSAEPIDEGMVPLVNRQLDRLAEIRRDMQWDKNAQLARALRAELRAAERAAEEVEAMRPRLDDAMRAAFRRGDSGAVRDAVNTVKSALSIGRNLRSLAAGITTDLLNLPVSSGTQMTVDTWSSQIGRVKVTIVNVNRYTEMLGNLGRGLAAINIVLTVADRSRRATAAEQGMKDLNDVVNVSTDLASLPAVGLPPHMSLMTTLYIKPALKVITQQIGVLVEQLSDVNRISVAVTGDLRYREPSPAGKRCSTSWSRSCTPATRQGFRRSRGRSRNTCTSTARSWEPVRSRRCRPAAGGCGRSSTAPGPGPGSSPIAGSSGRCSTGPWRSRPGADRDEGARSW